MSRAVAGLLKPGGAGLAALVWLAAGASPAARASPAAGASLSASARLQGQFRMVGHVTAALHVPGERRGNRVTRTWTFTPTCSRGPCATVILVRAREHGQDRLKLRRRGPGYYSGRGIFDAPVRCGGRTYPRGWAVPFKVTVRITAASASGGAVFASRLKATYKNRRRINRTPCVALPGHDAARYRGRLVSL